MGEYSWGEKSRAPGSQLKNLQNIVRIIIKTKTYNGPKLD